MAEDEIHKTATEARAGTTPHVVRYVLAISLALVVIAFIALLWL
ncbi:hypothetical protein [Sphingomonas sp. SCN 67-18]|nr:hypothetical protein [Sphingomonas sp. SCN 67-18]